MGSKYDLRHLEKKMDFAVIDFDGVWEIWTHDLPYFHLL